MTDPRIAPEQLREWLSSAPDLHVLDVRTPAEFESAHIPGSYNVPLDTLRENRTEIARHLDRPVVLVCRSGQRSGEAEQVLAATGLPNVHVLDGGITTWEQRGGPVTRGRQRWDLERQVRLVAGGLVLAGVLGSVAVPRLKWLAGGVGAGLTVAAVTNSCLMARILSAMPWNRGQACELPDVLAQLEATTTTGRAA